MEKRVKTTPIVKKYKDKKTGQWKELTINHAKVKDRIKQFWEDNPRGKIETSQQHDQEQGLIFRAFILADKSDEYSKEATGHSYGKTDGEKNFEKLETIAVGRALALLGYASDGEIASSEEMEEFKKYKDEKRKNTIEEAEDKLKATKSVDELKSVWENLNGDVKKELTNLKNELKTKYENH